MTCKKCDKPIGKERVDVKVIKTLEKPLKKEQGREGETVLVRNTSNQTYHLECFKEIQKVL